MADICHAGRLVTAPIFVDTNVLIYAEDLQADQELDGVVVVNPFLRDPASLPPT
jgi:hypothetical protein